MTDLEKQQHAEAVERAINIWLEKKWATFGKWTARGILAAVFVALMKWAVLHGGFQ
jgi:hypothetical protein